MARSIRAPSAIATVFRPFITSCLGTIPVMACLGRGRNPAVVLAYHDLRDGGDPDAWWRVDVSSFRAHLQCLSRVGRFISPDGLDAPGADASEGLQFLLTFDDGFANNCRLALPVLRDLGVHALFFVSTHHVLTGEPFWFDRLVSGLQREQVTALDLRALGLREVPVPPRPPRAALGRHRSVPSGPEGPWQSRGRGGRRDPAVRSRPPWTDGRRGVVQAPQPRRVGRNGGKRPVSFRHSRAPPRDSHEARARCAL